MGSHSNAEVVRECSYLLNLIRSLRRLWGVAESEREQRLLGNCLRQRAQQGGGPIGGGLGAAIDDLWECLNGASQRYAYAVTVLLDLDERELDHVFSDRSLWQTAHWSDHLIAGPPQWPLAYELLRQRLSEDYNLDQVIEQEPEMFGFTPRHGDVYWTHYCQVLRNLVDDQMRQVTLHPQWRRVAELLKLSRRPPLSINY